MTLVRDAGDTPREVQRYNISYIQSAVSGRSLIESIQLWYYPHDTTEWLIGRPSRTTHVSSTNGDAYAEGCTTDPCSESSDYTYVPGTRLLSTSTQTHDGQTLITRNTYGAGGLLTLQRLEGSGQTRDTELSYDASGSHIEGVKNPLGHETWSLRNPATGQTFAAVDENGVHTLIVRDGLGRITRVQGQDGSQFDYSYATGQINETSLGGGSASTTFDSRGRPHVRQWSTFDGGSGSTYSEVGQPRLVEYSTGSSYTQLSRTDYDRLGRPVLGVNGLDE